MGCSLASLSSALHTHIALCLLARLNRRSLTPPPCAPTHPLSHQIKVTSLSQQNSRLVSHVALVEGQKAMLAQQVRMWGGQSWRAGGRVAGEVGG